jgi:hypothetical protein
MKNKIQKAVFLFLFLGLCASAQAQIYVRGININEKKNVKYIIVDFYTKLLSNKGFASVDFGQNRGFAERVDCESKDGDRVEFNSVADLCNYFSKQGWDYMQSYMAGSSSAQNSNMDTRFIFKRNDTEQLSK